LIEHHLGENVADAAEAISQARREHSGGGIQRETIQEIKTATKGLGAIHEASLFGSYDGESRSWEAYFVVIEGGKPAARRVSFEEAAHHYGRLELRESPRAGCTRRKASGDDIGGAGSRAACRSSPSGCVRDGRENAAAGQKSEGTPCRCGLPVVRPSGSGVPRYDDF
jgi:hypothetical protein